MVAQWCWNGNYSILIGQSFTKAATSSKSWLWSTPAAITSWKASKQFHQIKTFYLLLALEFANLFFAVSIDYFCFQIVQVSHFDGWKLLPPHLLLLSQPCIAYQRSGWLEEMKQAALSQATVESKLFSMFSPWTWVLRKTHHYRMSCSYMLRMMCWLSGFAVRI